MVNKKNSSGLSTYEEFIQKKSPEQREKFEEGYRSLLLSELRLALKARDKVHAKKLAQEMIKSLS